MPFPSFSKTGLSTVTFSRGNVFAPDLIVTPAQISERSQAGQTQTATLADDDETYPVVFIGLPAADLTALLVFLRGVNWAGNSFTYTDSQSNAATVRFVDRSFTREPIGQGLYNVRLTLQKEPF